MKLIISITLAACITQVFSGDGYSTKYDNFNVEEVISNERFYNSFINCFLDKGKCSPNAALFKGIVPEALETSCAKCSDKQKELVRKFIKIIRERKPEDWRELRQKYDPTEKFTKSFEQFLTA